MTTDLDNSAAPRLRRRPSPGVVVRHVVDAVLPPFTFLFLNAHAGPRWAASAALLVALAIAGLRRWRGEPLAIIAVSTTIVALHSASAIAVGEGRAFFLPEVVLNATALFVCVASLLLDRPVTAPICRRLRLETSDSARDPRAVRRHRRLTGGWVVMWVLHVVPLGYLYAIDSVVGLTVFGTFFNKPTIVAMAVVTAVVARRGSARDTASDTATDTAAPDLNTPAPAPEGPR